MSKQPKRIHWIVDGVTGDAASGWHSRLASNRYRAILPAQELMRQGHDVSLLPAEGWRVDDASAAPQPDAVVIGKLLPSPDGERFVRISHALRSQMGRATELGVTTLADFNDDHFGHPVLGPHWRNLAEAADICIVGSEAMAGRVREFARGEIRIIGDPIGSPAGTPRVFSRASGLARWAQNLLPGAGTPARLKFAWYGNLANWPAMQAWADALAPLAQTQPFVIWVVTSPHEAIERFAGDFNRRHGPQAMLQVVEWDESTQWSVVADADIVLIPSDPSDPKKAVKTGNRLTDALNTGRYVIASPLPTYAPYAAHVALTDAPLDAVHDYLAHPERSREMIATGQFDARVAAAVESIAGAWLAAVDEAPRVAGARGAVAVPRSAMADASTSRMPLVRLNLGCGDKILDGYINVDVVEARAGRSPDVMCDLHDLSVFGDDSADEVMAIHVVEHFWRWEVESVLREWIRVLKPGGKLILECPNLQSACEAFLEDPDARSRPDQAGQTTMWVFYGDPQWRDPLMVHRWGYTPRSLAKLMQSVGLVDVRQEPAQYKLREPRDMRVVGNKPML